MAVTNVSQANAPVVRRTIQGRIILNLTAGEAISKGDLVTFASNGNLTKTLTSTSVLLGYALEEASANGDKINVATRFRDVLVNQSTAADLSAGVAVIVQGTDGKTWVAQSSGTAQRGTEGIALTTTTGASNEVSVGLL